MSFKNVFITISTIVVTVVSLSFGVSYNSKYRIKKIAALDGSTRYVLMVYHGNGAEEFCQVELNGSKTSEYIMATLLQHSNFEEFTEFYVNYEEIAGKKYPLFVFTDDYPVNNVKYTFIFYQNSTGNDVIRIKREHSGEATVERTFTLENSPPVDQQQRFDFIAGSVIALVHPKNKTFNFSNVEDVLFDSN